jgi:mono/diheme cytochrome c family protein
VIQTVLAWSKFALVALAIASAALVWADEEQKPAPNSRGEILYDRFCLACHGIAGDGEGPGAPLLWPRPRDFRSGDYKWRTTSSGKPPTDEDLRRAIRYGVPGTSMHAFGDTLDPEAIDALIAKLKTFAPRKFRRSAEPLSLPQERNTDATKGRAFFIEFGCAKCHGIEGRGDGLSASQLKDDHGRVAAPYDLTSVALRRPTAPGDDPIEQIYLSLLTGLSGTPMPAYEGAVPEEKLWAVATYVQSIRASADTSADSWNKSADIPKEARDYDRANKIMRGGYYPGHGSEAESSIFGGAILPQGEADRSLTPAQASLDARQCARCHNQQYREWGSSLHAEAGSPGLTAQLLAMERKKRWSSLQSCQRCHNPLAEQNPVLSAAQRGLKSGDYARNDNYSSELRDQGLNCASCHLRKWQRSGPPSNTAGKRLGLEGYPLTELAVYERSDFCMPCHQLPAKNVIKGSPLLNTYKEWLEGPYMRRGIQCQHCHMPDREHTWKGIHDPETFRQGIEVSSIAGRSDTGTVSVRVKVKNVGAGHYLPTTPTPAAWVTIQLVDAEGTSIEGAFAEQRIGRHLIFNKGWKQPEDTRIPPGESLELKGAWKAGRVSEATHARIKVRVEPDEYYERFYEKKLKNKKLPKRERDLYREALTKTRRSHYTALTRLVPLDFAQ